LPVGNMAPRAPSSSAVLRPKAIRFLYAGKHVVTKYMGKKY
jgi:hypothetical protein